MTPPTNGITPEVVREMMPPYELSADLLAAAFASIPPPPPGATQAWRQERAARLVQEIAGLMPADAPQARIAAQILIVREATDDTFARVNTPGLTVEQVCRLRRIGGALTVSAAVLERVLWRHQQRPVPFFGTVLPDAIDVPALAAGWGGPGLRGEDAGEAGRGEGGLTDGLVVVGMAGTSPAMTVKASAAVTMAAGPDDAVASDGDGGLTDGPVVVGMAGTSPAMTVKASAAVTMATGPDDAVASDGRAGAGGLTDGPAAAGMAGSSPAMTVNSSPAMTVNSGPPHPRADADATLGVVTQLEQGPGWTLDVVRPRMGDGVAGIAAPEPVA
jgi:hypothetical protein